MATLQVTASADDCEVWWDGAQWVIGALTYVHAFAGYYGELYQKMGAGLRFLNITVEPGATIASAYLTFTCSITGSQVTVNTRIVGDDEDDAATFSTLADYQARRGTDVGGADDTKRTTTEVAWDGIGGWTLNTEYNSPDISAIIQEIIDRPGWASGNAIALFWDDHEDRSTHLGTRGRYGYSYDGSSAKAPKLTITWNTTVAVPLMTMDATALTPAPDVSCKSYRVDVDWNNDGDFSDANEYISADIKEIHYSRGKGEEGGKAQVGQLTLVVKNADGKYSPENSGGALYGSLLPRRPVRLRCNWNGTYYPLYYGYLEEIVPHPHPSEQDAEITAVDGLDFLSRAQLATALWKDTATGALVTNILDAAGWSAVLRSLDTGQDTVPYAYWQGVSARYALGEIEDSELGFILVDRSGNLAYEDRHHRFTSTHQTSQATFTDTMVDITYNYTPKRIYNEIMATVTPWELQSITDLWTLEEIPSIPAGETYTWWGDASIDGTPVFVDAWTTPASTTDYTANSQADGLGADMTGDIVLTATKFAQTIKLQLENTGAVTAYITLLKARGTYYDDLTKVTRKAEDSTSQTNYQKRTLKLDAKYMTDAVLAQAYCDYAITRYKDPQAEISVNLINKNDTVFTQILSRTISDRVTIQNTELGLDKDFFIDFEDHTISEGGKIHRVTWRLADASNEDFWCLDYSELGVNTKLAY